MPPPPLPQSSWRVTVPQPARIFLGLFSLVNLAVAGSEGWKFFTSREPLVISCRDYQLKKPSTEWVTLTDANLDITESAYTTLLGKPDALYIPLRSKGQPSKMSIDLVLRTTDKVLLADFAKHNRKGKDDIPSAMKFLSKHELKLFEPQRLTGMIGTSIHDDSDTRRKLKALGMNLTYDARFLREGESPSLAISLMAFGVAAPLGVFIFFFSTGPKPRSRPPPLPHAASARSS